CKGGPWLEYPIDPPEWTPSRRDFMLAEPIKADKKGCITLSDTPGLGIVLDEAKLESRRLN
ncbi:MAG: mandelate racemase/muconate lactonizing enzyme family protein, partial [Alphaproteobacteria bacterium]|nr:mandelate racemase/muconate lactonizing enzyme family protein [Alphaproteobacteria bacterium]